MIRTYLALPLALTAALGAQSPLETTFSNPAPGFVVSNTPGTVVTGLFDVTVTEPQGIVLTQIDVQLNTSLGTNAQVGVWMTGPGGTHVGNQQNAAAWTQVSSAARTHSGGRVAFTLQTPVALTPGTYGMALHCIEANAVYHGGAVSPTLTQVYTNNELSIDLSAARMRASTLADPFGGTSAGFSPRQPAVALHYVVGGFYVDFNGTPTSGVSPLDVQFTSAVAAAAGVQSYAWDFDNDGVADSTIANPLHTFPCGTHTVSLTVTDNNSATSTVTKVDYVVTDIITPGFTNTIVGVNTVQFTDTSTPTPTSWAWDLDGDGVTDSTLQNPTFVYPNGCDEVAVTLTVSRACQPSTQLTKAVAVATTLETTFAGGLVTSATATGGANFVDVQVTNPLGVSVCGMHVNSAVASGQPVTVNLHVAEGTYVGATGDAERWRLVGSATATSQGTGQRTFLTFTPAIYLPQGTFGICIEHLGASPAYSNLGGTQVYGNVDLTVTAGAAQVEPVFGANSTVFSPRIANFALHYSTSQATGVAGYGFLASGCAGTLDTPTNVALSQPVLGGTANIRVDRLPLDVGVLALGLAPMSPPMDLTSIGMAGCRLFSSGDVLETLLGTANSATYALNVPNTASLIGTLVFTQAASLDQGLNLLQFSISDAAVGLVGQ